MKRQGIEVNKQLTRFLSVPELGRPIASFNLRLNIQQLTLGLLTLGVVSCAPAKPPAPPSPSVEPSPTPSIKPSPSPSPKPSTSSSRDASPAAPAESRIEPESSDGGGPVEDAPVQKSKTVEAPAEKPQRTEKPAPAIEPDLPVRVPQPSEIAPAPPAPKAPASQPDDPEPPASPAP
jgi:hypothetical protein